MLKKENGKEKVKNDIIFIAALLLIVAVMGACLLLFRKEGSTVKVTVDGQLYATYPLEQDRVVEIKTENGYNILVIENGEAYVKEASCPDGICSSHRPIKHSGASIICLPNKVVVSIEGGDKDDGGLDIIS